MYAGGAEEQRWCARARGRRRFGVDESECRVLLFGAFHGGGCLGFKEGLITESRRRGGRVGKRAA